jgi:hypothetical protein
MTMATSLALANPRQYDNGMSRSSVVRVPIAEEVAARLRGTRAAPRAGVFDPPAADWTTRSFVRRDCLEPAEGSAHFDDLTAHRVPPPLQGELLPSQDCAPAGDDDAED